MHGLSDSATCVPRFQAAEARQEHEHVHSVRQGYTQEAVLRGCQGGAAAATGESLRVVYAAFSDYCPSSVH